MEDTSHRCDPLPQFLCGARVVAETPECCLTHAVQRLGHGLDSSRGGRILQTPKNSASLFEEPHSPFQLKVDTIATEDLAFEAGEPLTHVVECLRQSSTNSFGVTWCRPGPQR